MLVEDKISRIKVLLKAHPKGLTITDISQKLKMNRNSAAKYLEILRTSGQVESRSYGTARVFFLTHRLPISALVSVTSDLVVTLDENHRILFINDNFCNLFSVKKEDATGSHIVDLFKSGTGSEALPGIISDVIADQETAREIMVPRDSGDLFFKIKSMKTVFDDGSRGITIIMEDVTREKKDKIELEAKESRYRGIVEDQSEFIIRFLPGGALTFVNASFAQFLKKTPEELLGTDFSDTLHTRDRAAAERCIRSLSRHGPVAAFECRSAVPHHPVRWISWSLRAIYNNGIDPLEYQAVGNDITEKKEAAEKIRRSVEQMEFFSKQLQHFIGLSPGDNIYSAIGEGLYEILPEAVIAVSQYDPVTTTLTVKAVFGKNDHDRVSRFIGRDLTGMRIPFGDMFPPAGFLSGKVYNPEKNLHGIVFGQIPADICSQIEAALDFGKYFTVGLIWQDTLLGNITFALRNGTDLADKSMIEIYARAASICLKRSMAENALRQSETLYRTVIENIQDVFYRTDTDGNLTMASPSFAGLLGYPSLDECMGRNLARDFCFVPGANDAFLAAIASKGSVSNYELVLKQKDRSPRYVSTNSHIYYGRHGEVLGIEGTFHDISERRAADKKVHKYIGEMEFLSQKLLDFIRMDPTEDIFGRIGSDLLSMAPGAIVIVNSFDPPTGIITVRSALLNERQREVVTRILGTDLAGFRFRINEMGLAGFREGVLHNPNLSLYDLIFRNVPADVCERLECELEMGAIYAVGFVRGGEILGNAAIILTKGAAVPDLPLIEMYARAAAIALQRYTAEEARRKSDEIFYNIAQNSPLPTALLEPDGTYRYINESFTRLFGYDLGDFSTGKEWFRLVFPDPESRRDAIGAWKADQAQSRPGCAFSRTYPVRCKNGVTKEVIFRPVPLSDGNLCIICEDITERNKAEQTNRLLSAIVQSTSDAVIAKDSRGIVISWNAAAEQLYGYTGEEMIGCHISRIIPANRIAEMDALFSRIGQGESVSNLETQRLRKDGRVIDVSVTISPITDDSGKYIGASTIARDITSFRAEEHLRENEEMYRALVENIPVGFYRSTGDPRGRFVWGNSSLVRILGYPSLENLMEAGIADMFVVQDGRQKLLDDLKNEGFVKNREIALRRADGETICVLVTALARFDGDGAISCINGIVEDITRQKQTEHLNHVMTKEIQDITACIPDPVVIVDAAYQVIEWNAAMEQLTGVYRTDAIGKSGYEQFFPFFSPGRPDLLSLLDAPDADIDRFYPGAFREGSAIIAQVRDLAHDDDPSAYFTLRATPLTGPEEERLGAIQIVQASFPDQRNRTASGPVDSAHTGIR